LIIPYDLFAMHSFLRSIGIIGMALLFASCTLTIKTDLSSDEPPTAMEPDESAMEQEDAPQNDVPAEPTDSGDDEGTDTTDNPPPSSDGDSPPPAEEEGTADDTTEDAAATNDTSS